MPQYEQLNKSTNHFKSEDEMPQSLAALKNGESADMMAVSSAPQLQMSQNRDSENNEIIMRPASSVDLIQREEAQTETSVDQERDFDAELDEILAGIAPSTPSIPAFEAITSTTTGESSRGELEGEIGRLWRRDRMDFTEAARHAASENTVGESGPRATQSPHIEPEVPYAQRWTLNLYASNYRTGSDLPEINRLTRRGSPYQQSLTAEFSRRISLRDPTAAAMSDGIFNAIHDLWLALEGGQIGELVVTFSGHGGGGSISGTDWDTVTPSELTSLAELAEDFGIHMVYILDTCRAGHLVHFAQGDATTDIAERIENAPAAEQARLSTRLEELRSFMRLTISISRHTYLVGNLARLYRRSRNQENFANLFLGFTELFDSIVDLRDFLVANLSSSFPLSANQTISDMIPDLMMSIIIAYGGNRPMINAALRNSSVLIDTLNDTINSSITSMNSEVAGSNSGSNQSASQSE